MARPWYHVRTERPQRPLDTLALRASLLPKPQPLTPEEVAARAARRTAFAAKLPATLAEELDQPFNAKPR